MGGGGGNPLPEGPGLTHLLLSCFNEGPKSPARSPKLYRTPCKPCALFPLATRTELRQPEYSPSPGVGVLSPNCICG